jgi:regulator of protease activity HflC (stomatin/prohibitin superfamily)
MFLPIDINLAGIVTIIVIVIALVTVFKGIRVVSQSEVHLVERFGKYKRTLNAGLNLIIPYVDKIKHRVSILERQLSEFKISVITKDNVEVILETTVFFRVTDAASSEYRIRNEELAIETAATSIVRSAAGKLDLDNLQSSRESMNLEIANNLRDAAEVWGIEITRTEITDVKVDEQTKAAQRKQLNAERERRAAVAEAEGRKRSVELDADAQLYQAKKEAEAVKVQADADAYSIRVKAEANAEQTRLIAAAIAENGQPAIDFEILKQQVRAMGELASSSNTKTVIVPSDVTKALGSLEVVIDRLGDK